MDPQSAFADAVARARQNHKTLRMEDTEPIESTEGATAESQHQCSTSSHTNSKGLKENGKKLVPVRRLEGVQIPGAADVPNGVTQFSGSDTSASKPRRLEEDGLKHTKTVDKHSEEKAVYNHYVIVNKDKNPCESSNCGNDGEKLSIQIDEERDEKDPSVPATVKHDTWVSVKTFFKNQEQSQYGNYKQYGSGTNNIKSQYDDKSYFSECAEESRETYPDYLLPNILKDFGVYQEIHVYAGSTHDSNEEPDNRDSPPSVPVTHDTNDPPDLDNNVISLNAQRIVPPVYIQHPRGEVYDLSVSNRVRLRSDQGGRVRRREDRGRNITNDGVGPNREFRGQWHRVIGNPRAAHGRNSRHIECGPTVNLHPRREYANQRHRDEIVDRPRRSSYGQGGVIVDLRAAMVNLNPSVCLVCHYPCARVWCETCYLYFCPECDQRRHGAMGRQGHQRRFF